MGSTISTAAGGAGTILGNTFLAPIKTLLGSSCEGVCSGAWDVICFIQHLCLSDLLKLLMILFLAYLTLFFFFLLFKVGIIQCIGVSFCKVSCAACEAYWSAVKGIACFFWHKLKNTKRVDRRRRCRDEEDGVSWDLDKSKRKRESAREKRKTHRRSSLHAKNQRMKVRKHRTRSVRLSTSRRHTR